MGTEMAGLEKLTAAEDAKLAGERVKLDLGEVKGAQLAARDAQEAAAAYTTQGMQSAINAGTQAISTFVPLFSKSGIDAPTAAGAGAAGTAAAGMPNQQFQGTPFAAPSALGMGQIAPQAARPTFPSASPLNQFQIPALGAMNKNQLDLMSREELLKLLTGGK